MLCSSFNMLISIKSFFTILMSLNLVFTKNLALYKTLNQQLQNNLINIKMYFFFNINFLPNLNYKIIIF